LYTDVTVFQRRRKVVCTQLVLMSRSCFDRHTKYSDREHGTTQSTLWWSADQWSTFFDFDALWLLKILPECSLMEFFNGCVKQKFRIRNQV